MWASWTIGVEMLFYVVFPLMYVRVKNALGAVALAIGCMLAWMFIQLAIDYLKISPAASASMHQWFFPRFLPEFSMGAVTYFLLKDHVPRLKATPGGGCLGIIASFGRDLYLHRSHAEQGAAGLARQSLYQGCLLSAACHRVVATGAEGAGKQGDHIPGQDQLFDLPGAANRYLVTGAHIQKDLRRLCRWHGALLAFVSCFLLTLAVVVPFATLSYYLVEKPGIKLGKYCYAWIELRVKSRNAVPQPQRAV